MPPCPCRFCQVLRAVAVTAWIGVAAAVLVFFFAVTGCGTITDRHQDFPPVPHWWEQ